VLLLALLSLAACTGGRDSRVRIAKLDRKGRAPRQVWVVGHGSDTLVALAGGPGLPGEYLAAALASLGTRHTIVIWEAPGSGLRVADPVQPSGLTADSLADDVDRLLDALGLERASLVAHDFGALVAARHSMRHPGRATRLALLAPAPLRHVYHVAMRLRPPDSVAMTTLMRLIADSVPARDPARFCRMAWPFYLAPYVERDSAVVRELRATLCRADEAALRAIAPIREGAYHALPNWEWRDSLRALRVPTLVIAGTRDTLLQHAGRSWAGYLPSALLVEVDASPLAPWVEWPSLLSGALAPFLDERSVAGGRRPTLAEIAAPGDTVPPPGIDSAVYRATLDSLARRDASASHR
jgi:pimeloyl-ACP methyl ester carboxylesterase